MGIEQRKQDSYNQVWKLHIELDILVEEILFIEWLFDLKTLCLKSATEGDELKNTHMPTHSLPPDSTFFYETSFSD